MKQPLYRRCHRHSSGYTLVELLVSAIILVIAVIAVIAIVRKGRELQLIDSHRRQAKAIIHRKLEYEFDFRKYNVLADDSSTITDTLSMREGTPLTATVTSVLKATTTNATDNSIIPVKKITVRVNWTEADGKPESVELVKWLAN